MIGTSALVAQLFCIGWPSGTKLHRRLARLPWLFCTSSVNLQVVMAAFCFHDVKIRGYANPKPKSFLDLKPHALNCDLNLAQSVGSDLVLVQVVVRLNGGE